MENSKEEYYIHARPKNLEPNQGRIYQLQIHYDIVYITKEEDFELNCLSWGGFGSFIIFALYIYFVDPFDLKKRKKPNVFGKK
jgi:hypothetical protein